jgi:hypothetical protein
LQAIYVDKHIPRVLLTKAIAPLWPGYMWTPLSTTRAGHLNDMHISSSRWVRVKNEACGICSLNLVLPIVIPL